MISITELKVIVAALSVPNHCVKESTQVLPKIPVGSVPENKPLSFSAATRVYVCLDAVSVPPLKRRWHVIEHHPFDFLALESSSPDVTLQLLQ